MELHEVIAYASEKLGREVTHLEQIFSGYKSTVHVVQIGVTEYILKIKYYADEGRIESQKNMIERITANGIRIPKVIIWHPEFIIMEKLEGITLHDYIEKDYDIITDETKGKYGLVIEELGEFFRKLHSVPAEVKYKEKPISRLDRYYVESEFDDIYNYIYENKEKIMMGYTHGDINNMRNIMVELRSGKLRLVGMVDIEGTGVGVVTSDTEDIMCTVLNNSKECTSMYLDSYLDGRSSKDFIQSMFINYCFEHLLEWYKGQEEDRRGRNNYVELLIIRETLKDYSKLKLLKPFKNIDTKYYL